MDSGQPDGGGTRRLLVGMSLASGITSVPNVAIVLALSTIHRQLDVSTTVLQWTVTGYLLAYSSLLIGAGRLADLFGRVRILTYGTVLYMVASVVGALADSGLVLVVAMVVVGVGAAVLTPASLAIVTDAFRGERRGLAVGLWGAATALFSGIAPALGGLFTGELSWRWILWLNVIIGGLILGCVRGARETRDETAGRGFDGVGLIASVGGLAALTLALNESPVPWAWGSLPSLVALAVAVFLLVGFVLAEPRVRVPLMDLAIFARRNVSGTSIVVLVLNFALGATLFFIPSYLQEILRYDPLKAGLLLLPTSVTMVVAMPLGGRLHERVGPLPPILGGVGLAGVGMLLLSRIGPGSTYADAWPALAILGLGVGAALTPMNLAALGAVERRRHAAIGGILTTLAGLGAMLGVAVGGSLFEVLRDNHMVDQARAHGIALSHSTANELDGLLSGAPSAAHALARFPAAQHDVLRAALHDGFLSAFDTVMAVSCAVVVVGLVLTVALVRRETAVDDLPARPNIADPFAAATVRP